jgi:S-methylmethionine-dependent homocysteine/selenocysteine methylase
VSDPAPAWNEVIAAGGLLLIDGGTGTELQRRGVAMHAVAWSAFASITHAGLLQQIHEDYIEAGARIITANTFAATRFVLEAAGAGERCVEINRAAIAAAQRARNAASPAGTAVAVSLSCLPPRFDTRRYPDRQTERRAYRELARIAADCGADLLVLEMMEEPEHAQLAADAAFESELPVWLGLSCRRDPAGGLVGFDFPQHPLAATLSALADHDWSLIAAMHSPPAAIGAALRLIAGAFPGPLGAWPELGDHHSPASPAANRVSPAAFASAAEGWMQAGARVLGGCCGTTPDHIRALRDRVAGRESAPAASNGALAVDRE